MRRLILLVHIMVNGTEGSTEGRKERGGTMSNIWLFEERLRSDESLQAKLAEAAKAYAGEKADAKAVFDAVVAPIATELGMPFTYEEATEAATSRELDDAELEAVAGGDSFCFIIGGSDDIDIECDELSGQACAYIGFTG